MAPVETTEAVFTAPVVVRVEPVISPLDARVAAWMAFETVRSPVTSTLPVAFRPELAVMRFVEVTVDAARAPERVKRDDSIFSTFKLVVDMVGASIDKALITPVAFTSFVWSSSVTKVYLFSCAKTVEVVKRAAIVIGVNFILSLVSFMCWKIHRLQN